MRPATLRKSLNRLPAICSAVWPIQLRSVLFTRSTRPFGSSVMYAHGARTCLRNRPVGHPRQGSDERSHGRDDFIRRAEIGTMPGSLKKHDFAVGDRAMD